MKDTKLKQPERRSFLKGVAVAGGSSALLAVSGAAQARQDGPAEAPEEAPASAGYRLSAHVTQYYKTLRV